MITLNSSSLRISVQHCDDTISKVLLNSADAAHTGTQTDIWISQTWIHRRIPSYLHYSTENVSRD